MANNKDFLSQFSTDNKPDSYKEEERIPVEKQSKNISPKVIIIAIISLIIVAAIVFVVFFMPKIKVQNFEGQKKEDAVAWIKQQEIETSGIIFKDEYDFDNPSGTILSQDPSEGKVRKDAKMTFVVSSGPDPEEKVAVPDFTTMERDSIEAWIKQNKLLSTKINTTYSSDVEADGFIKADYSGCDESSFTRGCTLKISISKGPKPEDEITMQNFVKKTYVEFETWATSKKLKLNKTEEYSETVDAGVVISQSVRENEKVKSGDTINVVVSKGKGVKVPTFSTMTKTEVNDWVKENSAYLKVKELYSYEDKYVIYQSQKTGANIGADNKMEMTLNLGSTFYYDEEIGDQTGKSYDKFEDLCIALREKGLNVEAHDTGVYSDKPEGTIIELKTIWEGDRDDEEDWNSQYSTAERLPLDVHIRYYVSNGAGITYDFKGNTVEEFEMWIDENKTNNFSPEYFIDNEKIEVEQVMNYLIKKVEYNGNIIRSGVDFLPRKAELKVTVEAPPVDEVSSQG